MSRRELLNAFFAAAARPSPVEVPVLRVINKHAHCSPTQVSQFNSTIWEEAGRELSRCGLILRTVERTGEILQYPSGRPRFQGLEHRCVNVVLTDHVPFDWDEGRALAGVATRYEGFHLCVIALRFAQANRIPFLAVNTVVHELLHLFFQDVFVPHSGVIRVQRREARVDWIATRLWLFGEGADIREAARTYLSRLPKDDR